LNGSKQAWYLLLKSGSLEAFRLKGLKLLGFQIKGVEVHCIVAFNGELVSGSMDQVNLESSNLKGHSSIEC
jgi:hypothetical protein